MTLTGAHDELLCSAHVVRKARFCLTLDDLIYDVTRCFVVAMVTLLSVTMEARHSNRH